jgi:selenocysteine-specific elongation factor
VFVVGTAGHVDHGKSTLVQALSGINPDRLREEQEREMTIDLGFAWLTLPSGRDISIIDVPGHEDFIKNMLAGVGGIDTALFVVAADEAVMPQTREHLAIIDLLEVPQGVVALTKSDLIDDPEWLELVQEEVRDQLAGTVLESAKIIPVSALTGRGLPELLAELDRLLDSARPRPDIGRPRLPIDRVFTISGFGTVVTGTLIDGRLSVGEEVTIIPGGLSARVRGLQTHKVRETEVTPGQRVAANLSGVTVDDLRRGQVLTRPGWLEPTRLIDARLRLLADAPWPLKHNALVDLYSGAARVEANVRLLDTQELAPGATGWVQFRLAEPMAVVRGDHYIVRLPSPSTTLGGGQIVQPHAGRRHRRFRTEIIAQLEALARGTPEDVLLQALAREGPTEARDLLRHSHLPGDDATAALWSLVEEGRVVLLGQRFTQRDARDPAALAHSPAGLLSREAWDRLMARAAEALAAFHQRYPLRAGMPREELRSRLNLDPSMANQVIDSAVREGRLAATATLVRLPAFSVSLSPDQQSAVDRALAAFRANPFSPPIYPQVEEALGPDLLQYLIEEGRLIKVSDDVLFDAQGLATMQERVVEFLRHQPDGATVAQVRDLLGTSRRYALSLLEELDRRRVTRRMGDVRYLR